MSEINSPLGKRNIKNSTMKTFEVPDVDEFENKQTRVEKPLEFTNNSFNNEMENIKRTEQLQEQRKNSIAGKERLNKGALERIALLLGMTQLVRIVTLPGNIEFELKSLKSQELREVMRISNTSAQLEIAFEMRRQYLARSIKAIGGILFEDFLSSNKFEDKLIFVDELDDSVANRLYQEILILKDESTKKFKLEDESQTKELVEDLKKS